MPEGQALTEREDALLREMVEGMAEGCVVPFLGAGVNCCGRPPEFRWKLGMPYLPAGAELSLHLAQIAAYPPTEPGERKNLLRVTQYLSTKRGYGRLRDELHKILDRNYQPTAIHRFFARLPRILKSKNYGRDIEGFELLIVTTNYDDLLERAFREEGVECDLLVYRAERNRGSFWHVNPAGKATRIEEPNRYSEIDLSVRPVIVKIHGAVSRTNRADDSYVITEDDYIDYLAGADLSNFLPMMVKGELVNSNFLFLGYSLQDWNLRVFLKRIWEDQQKYKYNSWAIQLDPEEIDRELWRSRNVEIIGMSLDDYMRELERRVQTLPVLTPVPHA